MIDWSHFLSHDAGPAAQFIKYALAGGVATVTHVAIFHLAGWRIFPCLEARDFVVRALHLQPVEVTQARRARNSMWANSVAFTLANLVGYALNVLFVFKTGRHPWPIELLLFYLVSGVSVALGTALMGWLIRRFGLLTTEAFGANLVTSLLINYVLRRFFIFQG